jgi:putative FmdB family regulatory protein
MPIYNFQCGTCQHSFEKLASFGQEISTCPECGSTAARCHIPNAPMIRFKGQGFYTTDRNLANLPDTLREETQ